MQEFDWEKCLANARARLKAECGMSNPPLELVCKLAALMLCEGERDLDNEKRNDEDLKVLDLKPEEVPQPTFVWIRVRYRGRVIVLVLDANGLLECYLEDTPTNLFKTLGEAMAAIDYDCSNSPKIP